MGQYEAGARFVGVLLAGSIISACGSVDSRLRDLSRSPSTMVVVKDAKGMYWAFPASMIKPIARNRISLTGDALIGRCSDGHGSGEQLGPEMIKLRGQWRSVGGFGPTAVSGGGATRTVTGPGGTRTTKEEPYSLSGCGARRASDLEGEIDVQEIMYVEKDQ